MRTLPAHKLRKRTVCPKKDRAFRDALAAFGLLGLAALLAACANQPADKPGIVIIAAAAASWTADLIRPFAVGQGVGWLALVAQVAIIVFGILFALELLNIEFAGDIVRLVVAAFGVALAIAFGVGGIDAAKEWWAKYATPGASAAMRGKSSGE